ncbi:imprinted and ancient [Favolaschia claudopus]|uniref:Imprinted and ancient n=1 Tax=Favolaschia claudopus TaxID=2862362 RepID=A0AAV9Z6Z7_9AGAR
MDYIQDPSCSNWASSPSTRSMGRSLSPFSSTSDWRSSPMLSSTASDDQDDFELPQLTRNFRPRPHTLVPPSPTIPPHSSSPYVAIPFPAENSTTTSKSQDVPPVVNAASSFRPPSPAPRFTGFTHSPLESSLSTFSPNPQHVAINNPPTRLRTSSKVYSHGLPQNLPPPPRPLAHRPPTKSVSPPSFSFLRDSYMKMLATKSTDTPAAATPATVASGDLATHKAFEDIKRLTTSPEWQSLGDAFPEFDSPAAEGGDVSNDWLNEPLFGGDSTFMTSPHEDVPYDDFGTSPMETPLSAFIGTPLLGDFENMESPLITDTSPLMGFGDDFPLFGDVPAYPVMSAAADQPKLPSTANLWTLSPGTPALESVDSPVVTTTTVPKSSSPAAAAAASTRRRSNVTGTRKNLTPASLIPLDAPTQRRTYITPSATSRKALPEAIVKKRLHSSAFPTADLDDDEELGVLSPTASEQETIDFKRRQNTLAARKSRKRKLEHQQALEDEVRALQGEVTKWRERTMIAQEMLRAKGVEFNFEADGEGEEVK